MRCKICTYPHGSAFRQVARAQPEVAVHLLFDSGSASPSPTTMSPSSSIIARTSSTARPFTVTADDVAACPKAAIEGRWATCMRFFAGPRLLVIDELGYLPLPGDSASALFQVINQRYLKSSTIPSTNVGIADWANAFGDATVAAVISTSISKSSL